MANPRPQSIEEDDPDILALRAEALSSLISKEKKKVHIQQQTQNQLQNHAPHIRAQFQLQRHPVQNQPQRFPPNGHFVPMPRIDVGPPPIRQLFNQSQMFHPMTRPNFAPRQPPFIPGPLQQPPMMPVHVNPNFNPQRPPSFGPMTPLTVGPVPMLIEEDMPMLSDSSSFEPTPPSRLSPRSAKFVAENAEALRRKKPQRRSSSSDRSRSISPYNNKYRRRSRSPHNTISIDHIARKRSKTPEKNGFRRKSRSPLRRRSQEKRASPRFRNRGGFRRNGSRDRVVRKENGMQKNNSSPKPIENNNDEMLEKNKNSEKEKSPSPFVVKPLASLLKVDPAEKREKTEQEIEDELLASTDDEKSEKGEDEFKMTLDEDDLDFLDDDDEESENEGRFKSKPAAEAKKPTSAAASSSYKSSYTKNFDKNPSRYDYKRDNRRNRNLKDEKRYGSPSRKVRKSPEIRQKSPEVSRKPTIKEPEKPLKVILSKEKKVDVEKPKVVEPKFRSTIEAPVNDKKKDGAPKKEERVRLVRSSVVNRIAPPKKSDKPKEGKSDKAILKRLGGYVNDGTKKSMKSSWAKDQFSGDEIDNILHHEMKDREMRKKESNDQIESA